MSLIAGLTLGCAQPQALVELPAYPPSIAPPPPPPPPVRGHGCPVQVLGYEDPSSVGLSAAELVAKFGNRRTAPRIEPALMLDPPAPTSSSTGSDLPAEASVSFAYAGGPVELVTCPHNPVVLGVPIRVTLELSGLPQLSFDARLSTRGSSYVNVQGNARLWGDTTRITIELDADDVEIRLVDRPDLPLWTRWSSLCNAQSGAWLGEYFAAIPGPLLASGASRTVTCFKDNEPAARSWEPPTFFLTSVDPQGCRDFAVGNVAAFRGEVSAGPDQTWMPQAAPAAISVHPETGVARLAFRVRLPPSNLVRAFHVCPHPPADALLAYRLELQRGATGVSRKAEVLELMYYCEDVIVTCSYDSSKAQ